MKFSDEQLKAITTHGKNILVSAGAGSGKTAVLTERIRQILVSGVKASELLVLTFTKAAANEMKERIVKAMSKDETLKNRTSEVDAAYITTFDSFSLSIVKKYHDRLNLSPNVSITDSSVLNVYKRQIIDEIFLKYYQDKNPLFEKMIFDLTPKDDGSLKKEILALANKIDLKSDRDNFLNNYLATYYNEDKYQSYFNEYISIIFEKIDFLKLKASYIKENGDYKKDKLVAIDETLSGLFVSQSYNGIKDSINFKKPFTNSKKDNIDIAEAKNAFSDTLKELKELLVYNNEDEIQEAYFQSKDYASILIPILLEFFTKIDAYKENHQLFEFTDIAKKAIHLVKDDLEVQKELKASFYEILLDEYQDTNDLQEEFISAISKNNVYMVGDIKQSIYGFRNANPLIFKNKYDAYKDNVSGIKIDLNKNFRSNRAVLATVNKIFSPIMDDTIGQANFAKEHQMHFGLVNYDAKPQDNKIKIVRYLANKDFKNKQIDLFYVVNNIEEKIKNKEIVFDKDSNTFRECTYGDFAILCSDSSMFNDLNRLLSYKQIPNLVFKNDEISNGMILTLVKNILKLISLDYQNLHDSEFKKTYYGVGRSFLFNKTDEELFKEITSNTFKESKLYEFIHSYAIKVDTNSIYELTLALYDDLDIYNKLITIGDINDNLIRLESVLNIIKSMEDLELNIFDFITYIEDILANNEKIEIPASGLNVNAVKIMTIHKSKGLEFPIVYFINNDKQFNKADIKGQFTYDLKYGFILPYFKDGIGKTISYYLAKEKYNIDIISEKIRLFYVALTRPREQMIIMSPYKEDDAVNNLDNLVPLIIRKKYNSFNSIIKSIISEFHEEIIEIDPYSLKISDDYLKAFKNDYQKYLTKVDKKIKIVNNNYELKEINHEHASKEVKDLFTIEQIKAMELGTKAHAVFESFDFIKKDFTNYSNNEKVWLENFLAQPLLKDINKGNIYKEYEFIDIINGIETHGIIDLMIIYDNYIDIIDYKYSHTDDEAYIKQLTTYRNYIEKKTNKKANLYLYSISKNSLKPL